MKDSDLTEYKPPILKTFNNVLAIGAFASIPIALIGVVRDIILLSEWFRFSGFCFLLGAIFLGTAQVVDFLGRTAHSTDRMCTVVEANVVQRLAAIENRLSSAEPLAVRIDTTPPSTTPPSPSGPISYYYAAADGLREGPFSIDEMRNLWSKNFIRNETRVIRDGDSVWSTYRELLSPEN